MKAKKGQGKFKIVKGEMKKKIASDLALAILWQHVWLRLCFWYLHRALVTLYSMISYEDSAGFQFLDLYLSNPIVSGSIMTSSFCSESDFNVVSLS